MITFNAAILDVRILGRSFHRPVDHVDARLDALARTLRESRADIIFLQELFHRDKQDRLRRELEKHYPHSTGLARAGWKLRLGNELLTLSRYPFSSGKLVRFEHAPAEELRHTSKGFYHMLAELPGLGQVNLVNFHMSAGGKYQHPESSQMESMREKQIAQLLDYCSRLDRVLLAGDLNAGRETSIANYRQIISAGFHDLFASQGASGISWDPDNPLVKQDQEAHLPPQRIDHIFTDNSLFNSLSVAGAGVIFTEHSVHTENGPLPLSDHYGISVDIVS